MYARFIDEFTVIPAPDAYWNIRDFNKRSEIMKQHGFLPVISDPLQSHMRPHYCIERDLIRKSYVEYSGEALGPLFKTSLRRAFRNARSRELSKAYRKYPQREFRP